MNQREASKGNYGLFNNAPTIEEINSGSLQRIADATELMAKNYGELQRERDNYESWYRNSNKTCLLLRKRNAALRGVITKLKKKAAPHE